MEGKLRYLLNKQTVVIEELLTVLEQDESLFSVSSKITQGLEDKEKELASLSDIHHTTQPERPTQKELDQLIKECQRA